MSARIDSGAVTLGTILREAVRRWELEQDGIVQGFGVVSPPEPEPVVLYVDGCGVVLGTVLPPPATQYNEPGQHIERAVKGRARGEAVAKHLAAQADHLSRRWESISNRGPGWVPFATELQAGAAACRCMAECLDALMHGEVELFKATVEQFVNDAVDTGVVSVG